jgi:hypothetical protein
MKKFSVAGIVVMAIVLIITSVALAGDKKGFDGAWEAIDTDGSYTTVVIQSDGPYFMIYDFGASTCGIDGNGNPIYPLVLEGIPVINENVLTIQGKILCITDSPYYVPEGGPPDTFTFVFTYDKQLDSLSGIDLTWTRIGKK